MIAHQFSDLIGHTPLVAVTHLDLSPGTELLAKAEFLNPAGSVKDRIAAHMIAQALARDTITEATVLIEPTSGNTGIALAAVCAAQGIPLILTMPESMSIERRRLLEHLGARIVLTPAELGMQGSIEEAERLAASLPHARILGQFTNPDNPDAHYRTTAEEILEDLGRAPDLLIAGVGTGGTLSGTGRRLRETYPDMQIIAVEPEPSAVLSGRPAGAHGIQGIGAGFVPRTLAREMIDRIVTVSEDEAIAYARTAAREAGWLIGISSGANLAAAHRLARRPEHTGKTLLTILPDSAERYLSTDLFA